MLGTLITMGIFMLVFSLSIGMELGKIFWTPPGQ